MRKKYYVRGIDCAHCASLVEEALQKYEFTKVSLNFVNNMLLVESDKYTEDETNGIVKKVFKMYLPSAKAVEDIPLEIESRRVKIVQLIQIGLGTIFFALGMLSDLLWFPSGEENHHYLTLMFYMIGYLILGGEIIVKAVRNMMSGFIIDENFLMTLATFGAIGIGEFEEAVEVMLLYNIGEYFQKMAIQKSKKSIDKLMRIKPEYANIKKGDKVEKVEPNQVGVGVHIVVGKGEKVPLDGIVVEGKSKLDTTALTGESKPVLVKKGDEVLSGSINIGNKLTNRVTKKFEESTVSKIIQLVEKANESKTVTEQFITKFAKFYTPIVVVLGFLLAVVPPLILQGIFQIESIWNWQCGWGESIERALTLLVIACPCALVLSVPLAFFAGIGAASNRGILVKGGTYFDTLNKVDCVVFDKTGTLTFGTVKHNDDGSFIVSGDEIKGDANETVSALRKMRIRVVLLSGDKNEKVRAMARKIGIIEYVSDILPSEKLEYVESLQRDGVVVFVGDGINDAPALAKADVGVAMGLNGTAIAIESSDIVLMTDEPKKVVEVISIAKKTKKIVMQNIVLVFIVKAIFLVMGMMGLAEIWQAVFADVGVSILAVLNSLRVLKQKHKKIKGLDDLDIQLQEKIKKEQSKRALIK
ncbi:MAG: HAD-IC family P-type ATPase [Christensenellaceae bacterium]|jgi:cation transport ATPase|nr:HAD-IC family P-type ATPase [Christensenellaceae bacterium]